VHVSVHDTITDAGGTNTIKNLTNASLTVKWTRTIYCINPDTAETQICDPNICYATTVSTKSFTLAPNASGPIIAHFLKEYNVHGSAIVALHFEKSTNPADSVTSYYYFNSCTTTAAQEPLPEANVQLFPNPVSDFFTLTHADAVNQIRVFTISGRLVTTFTAKPDGTYPVAGLPAGNYLVALYDKQERVFQAIKLIKQE
jgi:hypothetical protein